MSAVWEMLERRDAMFPKWCFSTREQNKRFNWKPRKEVNHKQNKSKHFNQIIFDNLYQNQNSTQNLLPPQIQYRVHSKAIGRSSTPPIFIFQSVFLQTEEFRTRSEVHTQKGVTSARHQLTHKLYLQRTRRWTSAGCLEALKQFHNPLLLAFFEFFTLTVTNAFCIFWNTREKTCLVIWMNFMCTTSPAKKTS